MGSFHTQNSGLTLAIVITSPYRNSFKGSYRSVYMRPNRGSSKGAEDKSRSARDWLQLQVLSSAPRAKRKPWGLG